MKLLIFDREDGTVRVMTARQLVGLARNSDAVTLALGRLMRGLPAIVPSPTERARGWKIVEVLRT